jgi:hypothetical protein
VKFSGAKKTFRETKRDVSIEVIFIREKFEELQFSASQADGFE